MKNKKDGEIKKGIENDVFSEGWGIIPNKILHNEKLTSFAKLLYCDISSLCAQKGFCWASNSYFAKKFGKSNTTISNTLTQLEPYLLFTNRASGLRKIQVLSLNKDIPKRKFKGNLTKNCNGNLTENCKHNNIITNNKNNKDKSNEVAEMIKLFEKIDTKNKTYYANKTQRAKASFLLEEYGIGKVGSIIEVYLKCKGDRFLPGISSPYDMVEKMSKLEDYFLRKKADQDEVNDNLIL